MLDCPPQQVLATSRSRATGRRTSLRRATDSDISVAQQSHSHSTIPAFHGPASLAVTAAEVHIQQFEQEVSGKNQEDGPVKVQRSLTWTEGTRALQAEVMPVSSPD